MEILDDLEALAKKSDYKPDCEIHKENLSEYCTASIMLAICNYVRELEQRLEAAEATIKQQDELITSYQQTIMKHIDTLAELEKQEESRWNTHDGIARPIGVDKDDLVYLRMKRQEIKLPYPAGMVNWKHDGSDFDVVAWADTNMPCRPAPPAPLLKCSTHTSAPPVTERASSVIPEGLHKSTADLVMRFAKALAEKLYRSEQKYGWSDGWKDNDWQDKCLADFHQHIAKGDPIDVAAYCAFMWHHGWVTRPAPFVVKLPPEADGSNLPFVAMAWNAFRKEVIEAIKAAGGEVAE